MNIVLIHCHYERGGVTQVVQNQVQALARSDKVDSITLLSSDRIGGLSEAILSAVKMQVTKALDYDSILSPTTGREKHIGESDIVIAGD